MPSRTLFFPRFFLAAFGLALGLGPGTARLSAEEPHEPHEVVAYAGRFDPANEDTPELGWELRLPPRRFDWQPGWLHDLSPIGGVMATAGGTLYAYGGFSSEYELSSRWLLVPSLAAGIYARQGGYNLGGPVEFRSALELSYVWSDQARLGVALYHLSNARVHSRNPGTESLVVAYTARLGRKR